MQVCSRCCRGVRAQCVYLESCTSLTWTELIMSCKDCIVMVVFECRQKHKAANFSVSWQSHFCGSHMPQKYFKWFISSELSVLLSWSINMQRQDGNQQCPSLTSEGRGLFLLISAEERPCYSEKQPPKASTDWTFVLGVLSGEGHLFFWGFFVSWALIQSVFLVFHLPVISQSWRSTFS